MVSSNLFCAFLAGEIETLIRQTGPVAKVVLLILLVFSLFSWAIILAKWGRFRRARAQSGRFLRAFRKAMRLQDMAAVAEQFKPSPLVSVFEGAYVEYRRQVGNPTGMLKNPVAVQRAAQIASSEELTRLERRLPWLATTGRGNAVHRPLRHGVGHHRRLPRTGHGGRGHVARGGARHLRGADHHRRRPVRRYPGGDRLQPVRQHHPRIRRAHGRLHAGIAERGRAPDRAGGPESR